MENIVKKQHIYFKQGDTREYEFRIKQLKKLRQVIKDNEKEIPTFHCNLFMSLDCTITACCTITPCRIK